MKRRKFSGVFLALTATLLWSANYVIARGLSDSIPPVTLAVLRWTVAFLVLLPIAGKDIPKQFPSIKKHFKFFLLASILGVSLFNTLIYTAGHYTSATNLSLIAITAPVFIIIMSILFLKTKFSYKTLPGIIVTLIGLLTLISKGNPIALLELDFNKGDLLMLLAAICFSGYSVLMTQKPREVSMPVLLLVTSFSGLVLLLPFLSLPVNKLPSPVFTQEVLLSVLYVGIFASIIAFYSWNHAILRIGSQRAGILYYTLPLFSSLLAIMFLGEQVQTFHLISFAFIIAGIYISRNKKQYNNV